MQAAASPPNTGRSHDPALYGFSPPPTVPIQPAGSPDDAAQRGSAPLLVGPRLEGRRRMRWFGGRPRVAQPRRPGPPPRNQSRSCRLALRRCLGGALCFHSDGQVPRSSSDSSAMDNQTARSSDHSAAPRLAIRVCCVLVVD